MKNMLIGDPDGLSDEELHKRTVRATIISRVFILCGIIFMVVTVTLTILIALNTNRVVNGVEDQQDNNTPILKEVRDLNEQIRSCTDPEGECSKRGAARTGEAVERLNQYAVFLEACADRPGQQTEKELRSCADALQKQAGSLKP